MAIHSDLRGLRPSLLVCCHRPDAEDQQPKVVRLNELALEHTFILLSARNLPVQSATSFYRLTVQAVQHVQLARNAEELRTSWVLSEGLSDFARALALWASPSLVEKHDETCSRFVPASLRSAVISEKL